DPGLNVQGETWSMTVNYGDGSQPVSGPTTPGSISLSHVYAAAGSYTVTVIISDNYGASSQTSFTVKVTAPPTLTVDPATQQNAVFSITGHFTESTATGSYLINWSDPAGASNIQSG